MPITTVGLNLEGFDNITAPDFNISGNVTQFINDIPRKANEYTGNLAGLAIMVGIVLYLYYKLADRSQTSNFGYSQIRSIGLATGMTGVIGLVMYAIGYFTQLYPVIFFIIIFMLAFIWAYKEERD